MSDEAPLCLAAGEGYLAGIADIIKLIEKLDCEAKSHEYNRALADLRTAIAAE
jgi:hypothetical protein